MSNRRWGYWGRLGTPYSFVNFFELMEHLQDATDELRTPQHIWSALDDTSVRANSPFSDVDTLLLSQQLLDAAHTSDDSRASQEWDSWSVASDTQARADSPLSDADTLVLRQRSLPFDTPPDGSEFSSYVNEDWTSQEDLESSRGSGVSNESSSGVTVQEISSAEEELSLGEHEHDIRPEDRWTLDSTDVIPCNVDAQQDESVENDIPLSPRRLAVKRPASDRDLEAACCSICLDVWAGSGRHRVVSLACGHVFGESCIRRWLRAGVRVDGKPRCPTCKITASLDALRYLRPALVTSPDVRALRATLDAARAESRRAASDLARAIHEQTEMEDEVQKLKEQIEPEEPIVPLLDPTIPPLDPTTPPLNPTTPPLDPTIPVDREFPNC